MAARKRSFVEIFLAPAALAVAIVFGLVSALLGDGLWDAGSWLALAIPLAVIAFHMSRRSTH